MAHFAKLDENNIVTQVIVVNNEVLLENGLENEQKGIEFCQNLLSGRWIQTSYNSKFRKNYANVGYYYDQDRDAFISPKPFQSWTLDEVTCKWVAPVPYPEGTFSIWDEENLKWINSESTQS